MAHAVLKMLRGWSEAIASETFLSSPGFGDNQGLGWASLVAQLVKNLPTIQETWVQVLGWEDPLENDMATHSSILAWRILWRIARVGHDLATKPPPPGASLGQQKLGSTQQHQGSYIYPILSTELPSLGSYPSRTNPSCVYINGEGETEKCGGYWTWFVVSAMLSLLLCPCKKRVFHKMISQFLIHHDL